MTAHKTVLNTFKKQRSKEMQTGVDDRDENRVRSVKI